MSVSSHRFALDVPAVLHGPAGEGDGSLVVALHGQGLSPAAFEGDVLPLVPPGASALFPQAPLPFEIRPDDRTDGAAPPRRGNAWYVYTGESADFVREMERTEAWLLGVIDAVVAEARLDAGRVALLGWSQGGYLAGFVGVRRPDRFRALVVASARIKDEVLAGAAPRAADLRVLGVHGDRDRHVSADAARASVERMNACGLRAEFRTYPRGHAVLRDEGCRGDVREFLTGALSA